MMVNRDFGLLTILGVVPVLGSLLFAGWLVYEQTVMSWQHGVQMVGFALFHSWLGPIGLLFMFIAAAWTFAVAVVALTRRRVAMANLVLAALFAVSLGAFLVPYEQWKLLTVRLNGTHRVPADWLTFAAATGERRLLEHLLANGMDVDTRNTQGQTALGAAAVEGNTELGRFLLAKGARVDSRTKLLAETPLTQAAQMNRTEMVKLLLENGADPAYRDGTGRTALDWAQRNGNTQLIAVLQAREK